MTVLRPVLVGLGAGAALAFLAALLGPRRRRDPVVRPDPVTDVAEVAPATGVTRVTDVTDAATPVRTSRPVRGAS